MARAALVLVALASCLPGAASAETRSRASILVINSYHWGFGWTDAQVSGIMAVLTGGNAHHEVFLEHMDVLRQGESFDDAFFGEYLQRRFGRQKFDLIMVTDDAAMRFVARHHADRFADTPIVFSDVSEAQVARLPAGLPVTGVLEREDVAGTLAIARQLRPNARQIVVFGNRADTGAGPRKNQTTLASLKLDLPVRLYEDLPLESIVELAAAVSPDDIMFSFAHAFDQNGGWHGYGDVMVAITRVARTPVLDFTSHRVRQGISLGGKVADGARAGRAAAELALRVLGGEDPARIAPIAPTLQAVFSYPVMRRHGIAESELPVDAVILDKPRSILDEYRPVVISAALVFALLLAVIALLLANIRRRQAAEARLAASEERLRLTLRVAQVGLYDLDLKTGHARVSDEYARMLGFDPGSFVESAAAWTSRAHPDDRQRMRANFASYLAGERPAYAEECRQRSHSGDWRWILSKGEIVERDAEGRPLRMLGIHLDITGRKQAEQALAQFKETLDLTRDLVFMFDPDTLKFVYVNQGAADRLGYERDTLLGKTPVDLTPGMDESGFRRLTAKLVRGELPLVRAEVTQRCADGSEVPVEGQLQYIVPPQGSPRFVAILRDITERKRAEELLRQSEARFAMLFHQSPVPLGVTRLADGLYLDLNDAFLETFRFRREELVGKRFSSNQYVDPEERAALLDRLGRDGTVQHFETRWKTRDGAARICEISGRATRVDGEDALLWACIDVTEQRLARRRIEELNATLEMRVEERTRALERAQADLLRAEKTAALGRMVAGVAHELNTPLGNSLLMASHLADTGRGLRDVMSGGLRRSQLEKYLSGNEETTALLIGNLQRAAELVAGFKRVAVDQASAKRRRFDLATVVAENIAALLPGLRLTAYRVTQDIAAAIECDSYPGPLGQVITNLVENAVRHGFDGRDHGVVTIRAQRPGGDQVILTVSDDGVGIPATDIHRIYDPFFTTRLGRGGSGLGLNIVYNIVTAVLGGRIEVASEPGSGTTFTVTLPVVAPAMAELPRAAEPIH